MKFFSIFTVILITATAAFAENSILEISWSGKAKVGDEYTVEVLSLTGGRPPVSPYLIEIPRNGTTAIGTGDGVWVCVIPHEGSRALGKSWLVLDDGRGYPLFPDETGKLCSPNNVDTAGEDIKELKVVVVQ